LDDSGWIRFEVELDLQEDLQLDFTSGYEPELTIDLGELPPYERGDHVWFVTNVRNPTKWNDEEYGNDMPACYLFDPYLNLELKLFFDMEAMSWMSHENLARFYCYRCGYRRSYPTPRGRADFGMHAVGYSGVVIRKGKVRFVYYLSGRHRDDKTEAVAAPDAMCLLVEDCLSLLPATAPWPKGVEGWREMAVGCARDMNTDESSWRRGADGSEYILNYVDGQSPGWKAAVEARGNRFDIDGPCLDIAAWSVIALDPLVAALPNDAVFDALRQRLLRFIKRMVEGVTFPRFDQRGVVKGDTTLIGCWKYVFSLYTLLRSARHNSMIETINLLEAYVDRYLIPSAQTFAYLFPLQWDMVERRQLRTGDTYGINGIYATMMLDRYERDGDRQWLIEAERAIAVLARLPPNSLHQEIFLLGFAVHAATRLFTITGEPRYRETYRYLLAQTLRAIYWFRDRNVPDWEAVNIPGTFQACSPINYGALFENIETVARIAPTLKTFRPSENLLKIFNLNRINNLYYFPKCLPEKFKTSDLVYVPREDIPQLGGPGDDVFIGQELYGAGYTFRAYTLWEAYAVAANREVMVLHLDAYEEEKRRNDVTFILYNPGNEAVETRIRLPILGGRTGACVLGTEPPPFGGKACEVKADGFSVKLDGGAFKYCRVNFGELKE
jgi:hypothetical protein